MDDFLQKLKKVVRIVLYGPTISQADCMKAGPYQLLYNKIMKFIPINRIQISSKRTADIILHKITQQEYSSNLTQSPTNLKTFQVLRGRSLGSGNS